LASDPDRPGVRWNGQSWKCGPRRGLQRFMVLFSSSIWLRGR
jgi:hypothetical protein